MITLYLTRKVGTEPVPLSLPATPADIGNAFAELDAICPAPSATEIYKVDSEVRNLSRYICNVNVEDSETLRKLNQLAELLQSMSREDQMKMEGVLDSNSINGMDDILNAASMVKEYALLEEVTSDRTLGNYLVEHGVIDCPENIKPYLDYVGIGAEFYSDHGGAYTLNGYVVRKTELPPQLQSQKPFREESRDEMLRLALRTGHHADYPLILPADEEYLSSVKKYLCIDEFAEAQIRDVRFKTPYIGQMIHATECPSVCVLPLPSRGLVIELPLAIRRQVVSLNNGITDIISQCVQGFPRLPIFALKINFSVFSKILDISGIGLGVVIVSLPSEDATPSYVVSQQLLELRLIHYINVH